MVWSTLRIHYGVFVSSFKKTPISGILIGMPGKTLRRLALACSLLSLLILVGNDHWIVIGMAFAQNAQQTTTGNLFNTITGMASILATVLQFLAFLAFYFLQFLLDPTFILGITQASVSGTNPLNELWKFSRDVMNIIFAFMLIALGIITVVMHTNEYFNSYFKKFIIAVILVNFSWFFPRVIMDVANVLTATIYELPVAINSQCTYYVNNVPQNCTIITDVKFFDKCQQAPYNTYKQIGGILCYDEAILSPNANTSIGILNGLVINYGRLKDLTRVVKPPANAGANQPTGQQLQNMLYLLVHVVFILILAAMLTLPLIAMVIVFIIRIPIIWLTIAFMPFMFLGFVIGDKMPINSMEIFNQFVKAVFLPVVTAIPITVGFILLNAMYGTSAPTMAAQLNGNSGTFVFGVNSLYQLMWLITSMLVIWIGFFTAISKMGGIYEKAVAGIKSFGEGIGGIGMKLPLSIPFIPTSDGKGMSLLGLDDKVRQVNASLSSGKGPAESLAGTGVNGNVGKDFKDALNDNNSVTNKKLEEIAQELKTNHNPGGKDMTKAADIEAALVAGGDKMLNEARNKLAGVGIKDATSLPADKIAKAIADQIAAGRVAKPR